MAELPAFARTVPDPLVPRPRFSICTLVTDRAEYATMVDSFVTRGFVPGESEFLYVDNTCGNTLDAYEGYNVFLSEAAGEFIILCHQDIELVDDDRDRLEARLDELDKIAPDWAVCGNSGGIGPGRYAVRISDPHGADQSVGTFPSRVVALDEDFIVVKRSANLAVSRDLSGFHLYGADLCLVADVLGHTCWVIDFHLLHKSGGTVGAEYTELHGRVIRKWRRALRTRWVVNTCSAFLISSLPVSTSIGNRIAARLVRKYRRWRA